MLERLPGGSNTIIAFFIILLAYTAQTESIQYVQHKLGYQQPLFLLYVTHSSFVMLLPLRLLVLRFHRKEHAYKAWEHLKRDVCLQLRYVLQEPASARVSTSTWLWTLTAVLVVLTVALTLPSVSWFLAVPFTSMSNITSIYNTFSLWALVFSVYFLHEPWSWLEVLGVLLGVVGVSIATAGGAADTDVDSASVSAGGLISPTLMGDALALLGAVSMAGYEVLYKRLTVIPSAENGTFLPLPSADTTVYESVSADQHHDDEAEEPAAFGLHALAMMSGIGFFTWTLLWVPLLVAHWTNFEPFRLPPTGTAYAWIALSVTCGMLFNGCFAILLSLWGPVLASMSCLLTTVLVQLTDIVLGIHFSWLSITGNVIIAIGFLCLLPW